VRCYSAALNSRVASSIFKNTCLQSISSINNVLEWNHSVALFLDWKYQLPGRQHKKMAIIQILANIMHNYLLPII